VIESIDILFAKPGQQVYLDAPEGRPSSVTSVEVWRDYEGDVQPVQLAVGAPSIESFATTFNASSGASQSDATLCSLASTASLVRFRSYLATNAAGEQDWVPVERFVPGVSAYSQVPLLHDYVNGDTFVSTRMVATIDSTWVANLAYLSDPCRSAPLYRHVWTYTVGGVVCRTAGYFDLTRYTFSYTATPQDCDLSCPGWLARLPVDYRRAPERLLREAARQIRHDLWKRRIVDYAMRNSEVLNELVCRKAVELGFDAAVFANNADPALFDRAKARYETYLAQIEPEMPIQSSSDGGAGPRAVGPFWDR
jgi:hypothetical protein